MRAEKRVAALVVVAAAAIVVHGYHPAIEDAEIYLPAVKQHLNPALYPMGAEFFLAHASRTGFDEILATFIRWSHLSFEVSVLLWQFGSLVLLLAGAWTLARICIGTSLACWGAVLLMAGLLTIPVSGTGLLLFDQYLTPRSISAGMTLLAIAAALERRWRTAVVWIVVTAAFHPLMSLFSAAFVALMVWMRSRSPVIGAPAGVAAGLLPGVLVATGSPAYREAVLTRSYFFLGQWVWYDWIGLVVPVVLLWAFRRRAIKRSLADAELLCRVLLVWIAVCVAAAIAIALPPGAEALARYQPMRGLHLAFTIVIAIGGGWLGDDILENRAWRWIVCFGSLAVLMCIVQLRMFPATPHVEWPGAPAGNDWVAAFRWIRDNTPVDAVFALDPDHMTMPGEDQHGFRLIAERSRLADAVKDAGASTMFPDWPLADDWRTQVNDQQPWSRFGRADFARLHRKYGVSWVVLEGRRTAGLRCPYENTALSVCELPASGE